MTNLERNLQQKKSSFIALRPKLLSILAVLIILFCFPLIGSAKILTNEGLDGAQWIRSLESLRDLDYQSWQIVVYPSERENNKLVLRIVGYPGNLRLDHPTRLEVHSGRREWFLDDITLSNPKLANDVRAAAAEFDLLPLLDDLTNNRPLRLELKGVFTELPIPPYLVSEWRTLPNSSDSSEN